MDEIGLPQTMLAQEWQTVYVAAQGSEAVKFNRESTESYITWPRMLHSVIFTQSQTLLILKKKEHRPYLLRGHKRIFLCKKNKLHVEYCRKHLWEVNPAGVGS